jgi:hypothetical protein
MKYFVETTYFDEPNDREIFDTIEEAAEYYTQAIDAARSYGTQFFGDWAQIRIGRISDKGREIIRRYTNEATA